MQTEASTVAGRPAREVDLAARRYLGSVGLGQYHTYGVGHGIGLTECLEERTATQVSDYDLPSGMTMMIDVGLFGHPRFYGARHEDPFLINHQGFRLGIRPDGASWTGCDHIGNLALCPDNIIVNGRRFAVDAQDGDIRTMHCTAHIQAASQGDAAVSRQLPIFEVLEQIVHHGFHDSGCICGWSMAVNPSLSVHGIADCVACAADCIAFRFEMLDKRLDLFVV